MARIRDIILRDTRANQPAATAVDVGTLYYVTDEATTERSNGTIWQTYSDAGVASGLDQLTGDVTAGPGTGSQVATIPNDTVTYAKMQNVSAAERILGRGQGGGAGDVQELTLGAGLALAGTVLSATGTSGVMPPVVFRPQDNEPPTANFATLDTRNIHPVLNFDDATDESAQFSGFLPNNYAGNGLTIICFWVALSATSGDIVIDVSIERDDLGGLDIDADSYAAVVSDTSTAPGTSGQIFTTDHVFTSGAAMDGLLAGELFRVKVTRDANAAGDTMVGDAQLLRVVVKET